ncbi:MAG TPA: carboxypeptidase-like regulatory domain-containing protein, partial [Candidatus Dormibacteraeota bacterium]|nr:carboxypeptidase-like regulatory domain-containing protein [Candidatus Dormibacteraeota bacterium]
MLLVAFLFQGTWALAGTTGGISGYVRETSGAPVADATLKAVSPSGVATSRTDATGHFNFLSLSPDTYTITVSKEGFADESVPGVVVFADQTQTVNITQDKKLATIARVRSVSAGSLVKSGVTADQYSVDSKTIGKVAALGGGGNLDSAYSAIASVPGVNVPIGGSGWNNNVAYIRGSQSFFTSY